MTTATTQTTPRKTARKTPPAADGQAAPPALPQLTMWHSVSTRVAAGIVAHAAAVSDRAWDLADGVNAFDALSNLARQSRELADLIEAVRELYLVPGVRDYLLGRPADAVDDEFEPRHAN